MIIRNIIGKYASILAVFSIIAILPQYLLPNVIFSEERVTNMLYQTYIPLALGLLLNLITAFVVKQDIRKYNIKTKYIMVATILYRPVGVFAFLLFLIFQDRFSKDNI